MKTLESDEKGIVEPNSDMVAMALTVIGFIIFISLVANTYHVYQEKTYIAQHYDDAAGLAGLLRNEPLLTAPGRPDLIDAGRVESLTPGDIEWLKGKYGTHYGFSFKVEVPPIYRKVVGTAEELGVSASVPVTIRLNEVDELPGTLTVKIWEK
ncbi:MAG: hypothetical protein SCH39_03965 [Methanosarcinales archaeon]|nr:hypothetical protein [ANME-2 cluster archaeon]MDW7775480.1 hypothetical protein [Methanosarcinales archaeon]